jgi:hypothetical protein
LSGDASHSVPRLDRDDAEDGAASDVSAERSPSESSHRSLPSDMTGLRSQTVMLYSPEEFVPTELHVDEHQEQQNQQMRSDSHITQYHGHAVTQQQQYNPYDSREGNNPRSGFGDANRFHHLEGNGASREADYHADRNANYGEDGRSSDILLDAMHNSSNDRYGSRQQDTNGRRISLDHIREASSQQHHRSEGHNLPRPKAQSIHQRSASNPLRTRIPTGASHPPIKNEHFTKKGKGKPRPEDTNQICYHHTTAGG